jgi:hypothetical protein
MNVSDFKPVPNSKLDKLTSLLSQMYGIQLDWSCSEADLRSVLEHYESKRNFALNEGAAYHNANAEYTKYVLITEAIRVYLLEIAPKRKKTQRRK